MKLAAKFRCRHLYYTDNYNTTSNTICSARVPVLVRVRGVCRGLGARGPGAGGAEPGPGAEGGALPDEELHRDTAPGLRVETQTSIKHPVTCCYFIVLFPRLYDRENILYIACIRLRLICLISNLAVVPK